MKQQCYLAAIYLNWLVLGAGVVYLISTHRYTLAIGWLILAPLAIWGYIRVFPSISQSMGYGRVDDHPAINTEPPPHHEALRVRLYTALGCPFCPIVEKRLEGLQKEMSFEIDKIDVTLRPDLLTRKGIRAVPVIEVGERRIEGNATSDRLAELISGKTVLVSSK